MNKFFTLFAALMTVASVSAMTIATDDGATPITADPAITVSYWDEDMEAYQFRGVVSLTEEEGTTLKVTITRSYISTEENPVEDQFCIMGKECVPTNHQPTQLITFSNLEAESTFVADFTGDNETLTYRFQAGESAITVAVTYQDRPQAITNVMQSESRHGVYTIFGQQLRADNSTDGLPTGMYIVGGKKVIVK